MADRFERAQAVADAVLYEGYLLYPYRRSSGKNQVRWQFGVLAPRPWVAARGPEDTGISGSAESWYQQTECLVEANEQAVVRVRARYLQLQDRTVERRVDGGGWVAVDELDAGGQRHLTFTEAVPREHDLTATLGELLAGPSTHRMEGPGGEDVEPVESAGGVAGRIVRRTLPVVAELTLEAERVDAPFRLYRLRARTENAVVDVPTEASRDDALRRSLTSAHTLLGVRPGSFLSLVDPPEWAAAAAKDCRNVHTFPVLAGEQGTYELVLSAPIILYDHPRLAPESPGDLYDATEIDEILSLRTLTLSDDEKREARATDPRAAALLDRVDALPPELMERLHGAVRSLHPVERDAENREVVLVGGVSLGSGSRVRLRPRRHGTDAQDMLLDGRTARVHEVLLDVDGSRFLAVTVEDDPAAEMNEWYGRFRHFAPDEVEPLPDDG